MGLIDSALCNKCGETETAIHSYDVQAAAADIKPLVSVWMSPG